MARSLSVVVVPVPVVVRVVVLAASMCLVSGALCAQPVHVRAERDDSSPLRLRTTLAAALMTSPDQTQTLGFDDFGVDMHAHAGYAFLPWFELYVAATAAAFPRENGRTGLLVAPTLGALASPNWAGVRPYVYVDAGPAWTGRYLRPFLQAGVGLDVQLTRAFAVGPVFGYGHVFQHDGPAYTSDARFVSLGVSLTYQPVSAVPERVVRREIVTRTERAIRREPSEPTPDLMQLLDAAVPAARVELLAPVLFKVDSDQLEDVGIAMLHEVARELARRPDIVLLEIQGYADARGSDVYNEALSHRRAERVQAWLVSHGVDAARLRIAAGGERAPVEHDATEAAHTQNRRVVFRVVETKDP
jgi:outer membrane protein OmpA-like peptidoglycan-associated protein